MAQQINIFEGHIPYYKITKPVRLIELFAGIGSQVDEVEHKRFDNIKKFMYYVGNGEM
jgi:hypothetical protein